MSHVCFTTVKQSSGVEVRAMLTKLKQAQRQVVWRQPPQPQLALLSPLGPLSWGPWGWKCLGYKVPLNRLKLEKVESNSALLGAGFCLVVHPGPRQASLKLLCPLTGCPRVIPCHYLVPGRRAGPAAPGHPFVWCAFPGGKPIVVPRRVCGLCLFHGDG